MCPCQSRDIVNVNTVGKKGYQFCICKLETLEFEMVLCENTHCENGGWFHLDCVGITTEELPDGDFFCSKKCEDHAKSTVHKRLPEACDRRLMYSKALLWRGLNDMIRADAIKENDGSRIIRHWKFDLINFS